jgi:hypothetical protein
MTPGTETLLRRYRAGARDAVWRELRELAERVRTPELVADAQAVCDEMARRARQNVEVIVDRLRAQGFAFHENDSAEAPVLPHLPPGDRVDEVLGWLERHFDVIPMTLVSWMRHVGDVWLVGTHPEWPDSAAADPLVVDLEGSRHLDVRMVDVFADDLEAHEDRRAAGYADPFELAVAPDRLHKDNTSGGPPYGIVLPDPGADGTFVAESTTMPFVSYLNWVFAGGGFPVQTGTTDAEQRVRASLARDLLPL